MPYRKRSPDEIEGHNQYDAVRRMVLWNEDEAKIRMRLAANQVTHELAEQIIGHAKAHRIKLIRSNCLRKVRIGIGAFILAVIVFCACSLLGFIPDKLLYGCIIAIGYGVWKFVDGLTGYLMAASKTGPIDD